MSTSTNRRVRVAVRTRQSANFAHEVITFDENQKTVNIHLPKNSDQLQGYVNNQQQDWSYPLDRVFHNASQESIYEHCAREVTSKLMEGFNGTIFAYGETGAGKTYTMMGPRDNYRLRGIIPRAISQVFQSVHDRQESSIVVWISYVEIYNEVLNDLLATLPDSEPSPALTISEDDQGNVTVKGLSVRIANNEEEALSMLFEGETNRSIQEHALNKLSSRSHCIFTVYVESRSRTSSNANYTLSKLNLVDLAGSERLSKTNSVGTILKEAMYINKSLSFLEQVIIALADKKRDYIPYRQSKLTHVLKDSLGGNCYTYMIANIWGEVEQIEETISTLRFAARMMCVANDPVQNVFQDPILLLKQYEEEIKTLKQELAMHDTLAHRSSVSYEPLDEVKIQAIQRQVQQYIDGAIPEIEIVTVRQVKEVISQFKQMFHALQTEKQQSMESVSKPLSSDVKQSHAKGKQPPVEKEDTSLVGDTDGTGFGVGIAPSISKHPASPMIAMWKARNSRKKNASETRNKLEQLAPSPNEVEVEKHDEVETVHPSTPPPKPEAFEDFKKERGREINQILLQNKESLCKKKREANELSIFINEIKKEIDEIQKLLESKRQHRLQQGTLLCTEDGQPIMEEEEFKALNELKQKKSEYRLQYELLQTVQTEMQCCKQYIEKCRERLLNEFEVWYRKAFCGDTTDFAEKKETRQVESEVDNFEKLQTSLLQNDPALSAFYNAFLRTERRGFEKRKAGAVTASMRNKPPGVLSFS